MMISNTEINIDLKDCYLSLGLNRCRGQDIIERIRAYLQTPGNSIRIDDGSTDAWKLKISKVSHHLLVTERWGADEFDRPGLNLPKDKQVRFAEDSTKYVALLCRAPKDQRPTPPFIFRSCYLLIYANSHIAESLSPSPSCSTRSPRVKTSGARP